MLAIDPGRSHTPPPGSRPNSRLEILIMDMARSQEERARSIDQKLDELARSHTAELANMMGRLSSLEAFRQGTPSPSPNPGRRGSPSSAETMHVSVPSTNGDLVPLSQAEVRRSGRLLLKPRP